MKIVLSFNTSQMKNAALAKAGIAGHVYGQRKPRQAHKDKRAASLRGESKHRSPMFD